jgi:methylglutaconyl-CoA hydratase
VTHDCLPWATDSAGVIHATLNRPDAANALNAEMLRALDALCEAAAAARLVVLSANGKNFCAGADLRGGGHGGGDAPSLPEVLAHLAALRVPLLMLVQGACVGGGMAMAACADMVVASEDAFFSLPEVRIGLPAGGILPYVIAAIGPRRARRYALTGERMSADEAARIGLVDLLAPRDALAEAAAPLRDGILLSAPGAVVLTKRMMQLLAPLPDGSVLETQLRDELAAHAGSGEAEEGRAAFAARRRPGWAP